MKLLTPFAAMCYDMLALTLTIIGLRNMPSSNIFRKTLRIHGIAYVVATCVANIIPMVRGYFIEFDDPAGSLLGEGYVLVELK
jgi:hypothetical protein